MKTESRDMTSGPILKQMTVFALPVLLGMLCQRIYNFADTYIVGYYLGDQALAAVSIAGIAMYLMFSIIQGLTTGVGVVISQYYGAKQTKEISKTFVAGIYVAIGVAVLGTGIGVGTVKPLLQLLNTSQELMPDTSAYLTIIYAGCGATILYNFSGAVLRAVGNSFVPLLFLIVSSVLNVILDIVFVSWIPMGVSGAALATVLAQLVSGVLCLGYTWKVMPIFRIKKNQWKADVFLIKQILRYGLPTALQMSIISISDMILQSVINTYGTVMIVAYGIATKFEGLGWQLTDAIGVSMGTFAGQNVGADRMDRVKAGVRSAYFLNIIGCAVFCPVMMIFAEPLVGLFTKDPESIRLGAEYMRIFSAFFIAGGILVVYHNILRASGDVMVTVLIGVSEVITRIGCAFLLPRLFGYRGLWFVSPITWVCAAMFGAARYYSGAWERKAQAMRRKE